MGDLPQDYLSDFSAICSEPEKTNRLEPLHLKATAKAAYIYIYVYIGIIGCRGVIDVM